MVITEDQWNELIAEGNKAVDVTNARFQQDGNWNQARYNHELSQEMLGFYTKITDPANKDVTRRDLQDYLDRNPDARLVAPTDLSDIRAIIAQEVAKYNALNNVHYPEPALMIAASSHSDHEEGSPASYHRRGDAIAIDADQLEILRYQPEVLRGYLAHELGHRYDRAPETLINDIERDQVLYLARTHHTAPEFSQAMVEQQRLEETRADYKAAQVTSPETMRAAFENLAFGGGEQVSQQLAAERFGLSDELTPQQRVDELNKLSDAQNMATAEAFGTLNEKQHQQLLYRTISYSDKHDTQDHASAQDRLELQAALAKHPELLKKGTNITFDGHANIVSVEQGGKVYTPEQVAAINSDGDREVASRGGR